MQLDRTRFILILNIALLASPAYAQSVSEEPPPISAEAQKLGGKFIPLNPPSKPMTITRGNTTTNFIPLPDRAQGDRMIPLEQNKFYALPARPGGPIITRARPDTLNADVTNASIEQIRKQQILDAAQALPTSSQPIVNPQETNPHGVKITHGFRPTKIEGIAAPDSTLVKVPPATAPYGSKLQSSNAPKGAPSIAPALRDQAAERARSAGGTADPLDVLMQSAP